MVVARKGASQPKRTETEDHEVKLAFFLGLSAPFLWIGCLMLVGFNPHNDLWLIICTILIAGCSVTLVSGAAITWLLRTLKKRK